MHPKNYKRSITKRQMKKCAVCKTYNKIMYAYADLLDSDELVVSFNTNYLIVIGGEEFTSDFVCKKSDGELRVRECCTRFALKQLSAVKLLDMSRNYWLSQGISDWGIVVDAEK